MGQTFARNWLLPVSWWYMHSPASNSDKDPYEVKGNIRAKCGWGDIKDTFLKIRILIFLKMAFNFVKYHWSLWSQHIYMKKTRTTLRSNNLSNMICSKIANLNRTSKWGRISPAVQWCYRSQCNCTVRWGMTSPKICYIHTHIQTLWQSDS